MRLHQRFGYGCELGAGPCVMEELIFLQNHFSESSSIQVSQVRELIEVKEVITPYGRSGS